MIGGPFGSSPNPYSVAETGMVGQGREDCDDPEPDGDDPIEVSLATVCPYEAQDYLDGSEVQVESVPMPAAVACPSLMNRSTG